ncbi:hypothetical protein DL93DRAFT_1670241 [Clavulina sp. PMI_390]|nr:hypothetical protein DL93DRAFT_1670241 [Clavulina sp. PMI_390]
MSFESLPLELVSQIFVESCDAFRTPSIEDLWHFIVHRATISAVSSSWRNVAFATSRLWSVIYVSPKSKVNGELTAAIRSWELALHNSKSAPLEVYIHDNFDMHGYDPTLVESPCNTLLSSFHRITVLELHLLRFLTPMPTLPPMPQLRRLCITSKRVVANEEPGNLLPYLFNESCETTLLQDLTLPKMASTPSAHLPFENLISLQLNMLGPAGSPLVWKNVAHILNRCQSLVFLVIAYRFTLIISEDLVLLPRLKALEVNADCVSKQIVAPNLRCFSHSYSCPFEREEVSELPPSLIYLRMQLPNQSSSRRFRQNMSKLGHLRVLELTTDFYPILRAFLQLLIETQCNDDSTQPVTRFFPNLRILIIRRAPKDRDGCAKKPLHELYNCYRLAMLNLRLRPSLIIHNAELYQLIHSTSWVDLAHAEMEIDLGDSESSTPSSECMTDEPPERYPQLEKRVKHIPDDAISPGKDLDPFFVYSESQAVDSSRALWDSLFARPNHESALVHPCCDIRLNEVWPNHNVREGLE